MQNAVAVCAGCVVRAECLDYAIREQEETGVWGGLSGNQRKRPQGGGAVVGSDAWYNDSDPFCSRWLLNLVAAGGLPAGVVDRRDIAEVCAQDVFPHPQAHLFAGIGGWPLALELAGWGTAPVWSASLPCQPFSLAGRKGGVTDRRHLWPVFVPLVDQLRPPVIFGEQVASPLGREWLAGVRLDLEALGYAVGAADLCAAGVGAPHIRQRLFWVANAGDEGSGRGTTGGLRGGTGQDRVRSQEPRRQRSTGGLGNTDREGPQGRGERSDEHADQWSPGEAGAAGRLGDAAHGSRWWPQGQPEPGKPEGTLGGSGSSRPAGNYWSRFDVVPRRDPRGHVWCRVEPGTFPMAHGVPGRVGRISAYGNAIVPQVAEVFVRAFMAVRGW